MSRGGAIFHGAGSVSRKALLHLLNDHYLQRKPPMQNTFEWWKNDRVLAVLTFGTPASRHMQMGACPENPDCVTELNRLWIADDQPCGTASWFMAQCIKQMPPKIILSYADTSAGHDGSVYRAANFFYSGWTDMERKTPRFDYLVPGFHSRDAFRKGAGVKAEKVRRRPKAKYWTCSGNKTERRNLMRLCKWLKLDWHVHPVPSEHKHFCELP